MLVTPAQAGVQKIENLDAGPDLELAGPCFFAPA